jgi:glutamate/tyrosine decarboxylase-like PLP-dependent enzyme
MNSSQNTENPEFCISIITIRSIAGQPFTGEDDDIQEIHDWLDDYERKTGISIPMHIDGASGGFVNPFLYRDSVEKREPAG